VTRSNTGNISRKIIAVILPVMTGVASDTVSDELTISRGIPIMRKPRNRIISVINSAITRKDQKLAPAPPKNCEAVTLFSELFRLLNNPPHKNIFISNPRKMTMKKPNVSEESIVKRLVPKSARTSILIPSESFSVIILEPSTLLKPVLIGIASRLIRNRLQSHIIKTHFHAFKERVAPDNKVFNIFITDSFTMKCN
jgi:hypothetical protein